MSIRRIVTVIGLMVIGMAPFAVHADGLLGTLPEDGQWVRYVLSVTMPADAKQTLDGTIVLRSGGRTTVNGEPCRWIEFTTTFQLNKQGMKGTGIAKVLIPEKQFGKSKRPLDHVVCGWSRRGL